MIVNIVSQSRSGGSGTNLQGETNFTFDGSRVRIEVQANASNASADSLQLGNNNNNHGLTILSATNAQGRIDFTDTVNTADPQGKVAYYHDSDSLQFLQMVLPLVMKDFASHQMEMQHFLLTSLHQVTLILHQI